jgi:hypothetical protein
MASTVKKDAPGEWFLTMVTSWVISSCSKGLGNNLGEPPVTPPAGGWKMDQTGGAKPGNLSFTGNNIWNDNTAF